jgi:hypothetical protein
VAPTLLAAAPEPTCRPAWLPKIADGSALVVPALQERAARYRLHHVSHARPEAEGAWTLTAPRAWCRPATKPTPSSCRHG